MIYLRLGAIVIVILVAWLVVKLLRSSKYDKFCDELVKGKLDTKSSTKDTIKDITSAEKNLSGKADNNIKEAEKLKKESDGINNFLGNRGVGSIKKGEDS